MEYEEYEKLEKFQSTYHDLDTDRSKYKRHLFLFKNSENNDLPIYISTRSLPKLYDKIYKEIERFPDYEYDNCIAYEMLIRTQEYLHAITKSTNEKIMTLDKLGLDFEEANHIGFQKMNLVYKKSNNLGEKFYSNLNITIADITDGINKLINFYLKKKQLYKISKHEKGIGNITTTLEYMNVGNIDLNTIDLSSNYYIPSKANFKNYANIVNKEKKSRICNELPLLTLEDEFLFYIKDDIPNDIKSKINIYLTRPLLRFKESAMVNILLNLNFSKKVLIDIVSNLKDEYEKGNIKTPINHLYQQKFKATNWRKDASFRVTKKSIAKAFFIYDLYKSINGGCIVEKNILDIQKKEKIKQLKITLNDNIEKERMQEHTLISNLTDNVKNKASSIRRIKKDTKKSINDLKKEEIEDRKKLTQEYKRKYDNYNSFNILVEISIEYNISAYMCKQYLKFMRKYIDNLNYKELIIGQEEIQFKL